MRHGRRLEDAARNAYRRLPPNVQRAARRLGRRIPAPVVSAIEHPLLSVVMPVYNVESYLAEAVHSVLDQDYENLELILVDDGSTDSSGQLCDQFAAEDQRVRVIHKVNGGLGAARNTGIEAVRGQYLAFIDSDDYVLPGAYTAMIKSLRRSGSDVVTGNVRRRQGMRIYQAWNESRSHRADRIGVTLEEHPDLVFDMPAWNKVFRTDFWNTHVKTFPAGKLYEDIVPMFTAFLHARSIDVLSTPVYVWRVRDDGKSITQALLEPKNIGDKMGMSAVVAGMIREHGLGEALATRLADKILEADLWIYVREIAGADDHMVEVIGNEVKRYWTTAPEASRAALPPERRVAYWLMEHDRGREVAPFRQWYDTVNSAPPMRRTGDRLLLDVADCPVPLDGVPDDLLDMAAVAIGVANVTSVVWTTPTQLTVEGYAYIRFVSDGEQQIELIATNADTGESVTFPVERTESPHAARWAWDLLTGHTNDGYRCPVDLDALRGSSRVAEGPQTWVFAVRVREGSVERTMNLDSIWRGGSAAVVGTSVLDDGVRASVLTDYGNPMRIVFDAEGVLATGFDVSGTEVRIALDAAAAGDVRSVFLTRSDDGDPVRAERDGVAFVARLPLTPDEPKTRWRARARVRGREVPVLAPRGFRSGAGEGSRRDGMRAIADWSGRAVVHAYRRTAVVDDLGSAAEGALEVTGALFALDELEVGLAPDGGVPDAWYPAQITGDRFRASVPYSAADGAGVRRALPSGRYYLHGRCPGAAAGSDEVQIMISDEAAVHLPRTSVMDEVKVELSRASGGRIGATVAAPVPDEFLGRNAQRELIRRYAAEDRQLEESVFFYVDLGANAADSALAIHQELRRRGSPLRLYWGVSDLSVGVPDGGIPIVKSSPQWFEKLNASRYVVNNYGGIWGLNKHPDQRYLQTWHGTPYKFVGVSEYRHKSLAQARIDQVAIESAGWDAFVSPSPYMSELIRSEWRFEGPILETGYPRNDRLALDDPDDRAAQRSALGLPDDAKVLLYAPTFRENRRHGWRATLFDGLDLERLLTLLGPDWRILLRGHSFNAREDRVDRSAGRLIDVTRYPDVNDLYLAADVLVTDYSSVMFDFAVTGKPIAYFTPDIAQYVASRGVYFDLAEAAPGPMYADVVHLADGVRDLDALKARHHDRYAAFRERFAPWDDGKAAVRVVDAFFA